MMFENLIVDRDGPLAVITINRPRVLNALNTATIHELNQAVRQIRDDARVRAAIITGAGDRAFAAGADINELGSLSPIDAYQHARDGQRVFDAVEELGKPVIAAINGFALGGGCELAMACTMRVASMTARLGQPEVSLGLMPGYAGTQRLPRLVGQGVALDLLLTGRQLSADEALQVGLVNRVVAAEELMPSTRALALELAAKAPLAMRSIINAVQRGAGLSLVEAQAMEAALFALLFSTSDAREGTAAFLAKRPPNFAGE